MKKIYLIFCLFVVAQTVCSQTIYSTINSSKLGEERQLKIQLPRNYEQNIEKKYPLIVVLDGDYLFEPFAGNVDYYSYWDDIPEAIVVGINMDETRNEDCFYDEKSTLPVKSGALFFEFIGMELLPHIDQKYRTSDFQIIAGHNLSANFLNYYLFKEEPIFEAYISLSPDLASEMAERIHYSLNTAAYPRWYYLATGQNDISRIKEGILALDAQLKTIQNDNVRYRFRDFEEASHYSLVGYAIPDALIQIFASYPPMGVKEYDQMVAVGSSPYDFLVSKYDMIKHDYGMEKKIRINDFLTTGKALEAIQNWEQMEALGKLARKQYPNSALGTYYLARAYEASGDPKKAMRTYQMAYGQEEVAFITIDFMLKKAELIKKDFGY